MEAAFGALKLRRPTVSPEPDGNGPGAPAKCQAEHVNVHVVVGDDHPMFREGVVRALSAADGIEVVAEADDGAEALEVIRARRPQVALLDYRMPGLDGAAVAAAVTSEALPTRVLVLSGHDESAIVYSALEDGAAGFLPKESSRAEIVKAVRDCAAGRDVLPSALAAGLVSEVRRRKEGPALSDREAEVLGGIAQGKSVPVIAGELFLAPSTVKTHVQRLYEKLGVTDRAAAVAEAMRRGLLR